MSLNIISNSNYDIISLQGSIHIGTIPSLTPQLSEYFQCTTPKDVIIDLTNVVTMDSSFIRLLINLKKKIEGTNNHFYLMRPSEDIMNFLKDSNLHKVITIIADTFELQKLINKTAYERFLPFTHDESSMKRFTCSCGACGSHNVIGYLLNPNMYKWKWRENDFFPYSEDQSGTFFDYYSALPIICTECLMSSIEISHFNILDSSNNIHFKSILDDKTKLLLSKSTKKRKKMMEMSNALSDMYFLFPRKRMASYQAYLLAESCAKSIAINKGGIDPFIIGYMNFIALQFSPNDQKDELINNCRTWLTQVLTDPTPFSHLQITQTYYMMMIASLQIDKIKDASKYFTDLSTLISTFPDLDKTVNEISSPFFWFSKAEMIWNKEIEKKSNSFKI